MDTRLQRIAVYIVIIAVLIGVGFLVYRFLQSPKPTSVKTLVINKDGKFTQSELKLSNTDTLKIKNEDDKKYTVKKSPSGDTVVDVNPGATTRELNLTDNTKTELYLSNDSKQKVAVLVGNVPVETAETPDENQNNTQNPPAAVVPPGQSGQTAGIGTNNNQPLPNTGPETLYLVPFFSLAGFALYKLSSKI